MITHDLATVFAYADRVAVMYLGRIVESGPTGQVLADPQHPYTRALLSVLPVADPDARDRAHRSWSARRPILRASRRAAASIRVARWRSMPVERSIPRW